ncbi:hypothetical protein D7Y13_11710 [Corallococcus praedator]|uniref:Uncharacterized protein n=1 Tax=Corallococcus praedator TaxID=2316724 RepID=A0ABX9QK30_9BACT|nr:MULTISPECIES: hypothetical protein [Corallococcus]RKH34576.1 hypothetical protein D7X75_07720 [Corallococcus sp. CA031C]RKI10988.1 hypothetical protein D7Y13_11710 [Corallococcus praedator]
MPSSPIYALVSTLSDPEYFESLVQQLLQRSDMPGLVPRSGPTDLGADAEVFGSSTTGHEVTVVQISLQKTYEAKIRQTAKRLREAGRRCDRLVFVSNQDIDARTEQKLRVEIKEKYDVHLEARDWRWLRMRLNDPRNGDLYPGLRQRYREAMPIFPEGEPEEQNLMSELMGFIPLTPEERRLALDGQGLTELSSVFGFKGPVEGVGTSALILIDATGDYNLPRRTRVFVGKPGGLRLVHCIDDARALSAQLLTLDGGRTPQVLLNLWSGGTGGMSDCCILYGPGFSREHTAFNQYRRAIIRDVDADGIDEVILASETWASVSMSTAIYGWDVFRWTGSALAKCSERCPDFYRDILHRECPEELKRFYVTNMHCGAEAFERFKGDVTAKAARALMMLAGVPENYAEVLDSEHAGTFRPTGVDVSGITRPFLGTLISEEDE